MNAPAIIIKLSEPPPSLNNAYVTIGRKRIKSRRYRKWLAQSGWEILSQRAGCVGGPWAIDIALPANLRGDPDNRIKGILDVLVRQGVVDDDKFCQRINIARTKTTSGVVLTISQAA